MSTVMNGRDVRVSVVMSVYNAERYLARAVESILEQDFEEFEFIVVDDGSSDGSRDILNGFTDKRLLVLEQHNQGLPKALNRGISQSRAPLIARMDADDIAMQNRLQLQVEFLDTNTDHVAVGSNARVIDEAGRYVYTTDYPVDDENLRARLPVSPLIHPSSVFRKAAFDAAGGYCEQMIAGQDTVLFNRIMREGKVANLAQPLIKYRIVPTSISKRERMDAEFSRIMRKAIMENEISREEAIYLMGRAKDRTARSRALAYHTFLAKKLLWNNYKPEEARQHLRKSVKLQPTFEVALLYAASFLPARLVKQAYRTSKVWVQ